MKLSKTNPLAWLASLRLTVVLLTMAMYLIFVGTLAQTELGIWHVVEKYFRSGVVFVPLDVFRSLYPASTEPWPGAHPFPGGFLLIALLLVNLLAAHAIRFKVTGKGVGLLAGCGLIVIGTAVTTYTVLDPQTAATIQQDVILMLGIWSIPMTLIGVGCLFVFGNRKAGIVLLHAGLILMLVGEYVTGLSAEEGRMWIHEQGASNKTFDIREAELAFVTTASDGKQEHTVVPQAMIESAYKNDKPIKSEQLPLTVRVDRWMANSTRVDVKMNSADPTELTWTVGEKPTVTGTEQEVNQPSVIATLYHGDQSLGEHLLSTFDTIRPVRLKIDGRVWEVSLRFKETPLPYTLQLVDFKHDLFTGTRTARNFSSDLRLRPQNPEENRDAFIKMNQPLRYDGKAFFQSSFFQQRLNKNLGTIIQVVDNPGAWVPYLSCVIVTVGLSMHFVVSLVRYGRRARA